MKYQLATVIVTAAIAAHMRVMGQYLDRMDMGGLFLTPCQPIAGGANSHFVNSGMFPKAFLVAMRDPVVMFTRVSAAFVARGETMPLTQLQVTNRINACTVVIAGDYIPTGQTVPIARVPPVLGGELPETPHQTLARVGLRITPTSL